MIWNLLITTLLVFTPTKSRVVIEESPHCSLGEFPCDNTCIRMSHVCDGVADCADGLDESVCVPGANTSLVIPDFGYRGKRQSGCRRTQWQCRDGSCINFDGKCDGIVDCPDRSDETHALCRNTPCQDNLFRCTYGACVDGTAPCNGVSECADNSDEVLPRCRNETRTERGRFKCNNGEQIPVTDLCDGEPNCSDGSDETLEVCADTTCPSYLFQCAYGACVDQGSDCNDKKECADNSDESDELCNRISTDVGPPPTTVRPGPNICVLPPYPSNGRYETIGAPFAKPGDRYNNVVVIEIKCDDGYGIEGESKVICTSGRGFERLPQCTRYCILTEHVSVEYFCSKEENGRTTTNVCGDKVYPGTTVIPKCRSPNYYGTNSYIHCKAKGVWDKVAKCKPECGRVTPEGQEYVIDGKRVQHGELPWHAGIYRKTSRPYTQICGGSLTSTTTVITAAHCFWSDATGAYKPTNIFAVALGKIYRPWDDTHDEQSQHFNVAEIHTPTQFRGTANNFQYDIAIVVLEGEVAYQTFIRPVCLSFEISLARRQLKPGKKGKVAGWGLTAANGPASQVLLTVELPYVNFDQCFRESPPEFREFITGDKFCAGFLNGTALCQGDSGGGLAFPDYEQGIQRYYLHGIVSTAPRNQQTCDPNVRTTFTSIISQEALIKEYVDIES